VSLNISLIHSMSLKVIRNYTVENGVNLLVFRFWDIQRQRMARDLENRVTGHSRSLKLVPFESLSKVSYSPMAVSSIVSCDSIVRTMHRIAQ